MVTAPLGTTLRYFDLFAHRVALQARADAARRRTEEQKAGQNAVAWGSSSATAETEELRRVLHAEIDRLTERLRLPLVLCDLEGLTREEAAGRLRWTEGTVRGRLARARGLLRDRLSRRGVAVAVSVSALAATLAGEAKAAVPELPLASTFARPAASALANRVMRAFLVSRLLWTATLTFLIATPGTSAGLLADLQFTRPQRSAGSPAAAAQTPSTPEEIQRKQGDRPTSKLTPAQVQAILKAHGPLRDYEFKGRVVDPAGKPVAGAKVYVFGAPSSDQPKATIGPDGRFQFTLKGTDPMKGSRVAAVADGYAMTGASRAFQYFYDTIPNDTPESGRDLTIALVPDFPVTGQVVDPEGKPIAGVSIRSSFVYAARADRLDRFIQAIKTREGRKDDTEFKYLKQDRVNDWWRMVHEILATTDAQGRFVLRGISRESLAILSVDGPTIRPTDVHVLTRPGEPLQALISAPFPEFGSITYYGASPRITVSPGRVVEGVVRDAETGEALPKALITSEKLADSNVWNNTQLRQPPTRTGVTVSRDCRWERGTSSTSGRNRSNCTRPPRSRCRTLQGPARSHWTSGSPAAS